MHLVHAMAKRDDLELHVVSCNRTVNHSFTERRGAITFHWLATGKRLYGLRAATLDSWRVRQVYDRIQPDIIHAQNCSEYSLGAPPDVPLVITVHGLEFFAPVMQKTGRFKGLPGAYRRFAAGWMIRESTRKCSAVISIAGDYVPKAMGSLLRNKSIYNIANPLGDDLWVATSGFETDGTLLCAGEIIERKNAIGLVRAFGLVAGRLPWARLELAGGIGEPSYFRRVQREITHLGIQTRVTFLGQLNRTQLLDAYSRCSIVVLASVQETAPMALAEAMAAGRPVVATRVGGIPWMIEDGATGYLVDVGDTESMSARILELLTQKSKRARMGAAAREKAQQLFTADEVADRTIQAYNQLLEGRRN